MDLRVPKRKVAAEVVLTSGESLAVEFFLAEFSATHNGPERVQDVLAGPDEFFPAFVPSTGEYRVVNRTELLYARASVEAEPGTETENIGAPVTLEIEVTLRNGAKVRGTVKYERPANRQRLVDYVNEPDPFMRVVEGGTVAIVNKRAIQSIRELSVKRS